MARRAGPDEAYRGVYTGSGAFLADGMTVRLCADAAMTTPADVLTEAGDALPISGTARVTSVDSTSRIPRLQYPADGSELIYCSVNDGPVVALLADRKARTDELAARIAGQGATAATDPLYYTSGTDLYAPLTAIIAAMPSTGGHIAVPPGAWTLSAPVNLKPGVRISGAGSQATKITGTTGTFTWDNTVHDLVLEHLYLQANGGHVLTPANTSAGIYVAMFRHCAMVVNHANYSIFSMTGSALDYDKVVVEHCDLTRLSTATVPGWNVVNSGSAANENTWRNLRCFSANCTSTPFIYLESTANANYAYDNRFEDVLGEQCAGGVLEVRSGRNIHIHNVVDWDTTVTATSDVVKVGKSTAVGAQPSRNVYAAGVGRRGGAGFSYGTTQDVNFVATEVKSGTIVEPGNSGTSGRISFGVGDNITVLNAPVGGAGWSGQPAGVTSYFGGGAVFEQGFYLGSVRDSSGTGSPEGVVTAPVGSTYRRTNGGAGTAFYVKETGAGNTGWVAK